MTPRIKFNLALIPLLIACVGGSGFVAWDAIQRIEKEHLMETATVLMAAAESTRQYTTKFVKPHLDGKLEIEFLPQTVPAFAATETLNELRKNFPDFSYKEATLNPTNPRDRTSDWEADIVNVFRGDESLKQVMGERTQVGKRVFYFAKPLQIQSPSCLSCHSTPAAAPPSMLKLYGEGNGFGWRLNETIGAMIVTVPMRPGSTISTKAFVFVMASLSILAGIALVIGNLQFKTPKRTR